MRAVLFWLTVAAVAVTRLMVANHPPDHWTPTDLQKDFAHLVVGWLIGNWWFTGRRTPLAVAVLLTAFEVLVFILRK